MFTEIFLFELRYRLKRPASYIYLGLMLLMSFLLMLALGGAFGGSIILGDASGGKVFANSPYQINWIITLLSWFGVLITSAMMGTPIFRDFEHKTHSLYYTSPISKSGYLFGRFLGSFLITFLVFLGAAAGAMLATVMPWVEADKIGPFNLMWYLQPYLTIVIPNLILTGAIFFTFATLTRSALSIYVGGVLFLVLYGVSSSLTGDLDNEMVANLVDPMGASAIYYTQRYWTTAERNTLMLPFSEHIILNRALWTGVGLALLAFCYFRFSFSFANEGVKLFRKRSSAEAAGAFVPTARLQLPKVSQNFSFSLSLSQYFKLSKLEFKGVVKSVYFIAITIAGVVFLFASGSQVGKMYGTTTFPVTSEVVQLLSGTFALFFLIIITFYAGELVWRERDTRMNQIYDALPIPNWVPFASKLTALMLIQVVLLFVIMLCGIIIQSFKGYFKFELDVYFVGLFGIQLIDYLLLCVLAMLVQVIVNNKYMGHFVMVVYYLFNIFKGQMGWEHNLYSFNSDPGITYSAMNGYGHFVWPFTIFKIYWGAFALLLAILSNMLWARGSETMLKWRFKLAGLQLTKSTLFVTAAGLVVVLVTGSFIFYNTNILNEYKTSDEREKMSADYEKKYKKYDGIPQPRITDVKLDVDIYPQERVFAFKGYYWVKNKHNTPIDSVHLMISDEAEIRKMELSKPAELVLTDKEYGYYIYKMAQPLQPGDSVQLNLDLNYATKGFRNRGSNTGIVYNGTFINSQYLPAIGYQSAGELSDDDTRKEQGLEPKERMADVNDMNARQNTYISNSADWINFEATVSTSKDQIAIAPGYLQKEWTEGDRRYFHYKMDAPILNFYSFLSADYQVKKDTWTGKDGKEVAIEVYYHKGHEYNLDRMIKSVKKSLDYFTTNFSPYQHRQVRILEFPGYQSFAQSFPNTIPYSEAIGFIADVDENDPEDVDYPFYVTAHEVAHQWWAHQVIGGDVQGSVLMSETMSQYSALMVMKKEYGEEKMNKFLKYELNSYLTGRTAERKKEMPLYKVENQGYIHYRKGSMVMYALANYIGEDNLNATLKKYINKVAFQKAPYTNSIEFMQYIREATPDSLQYLVTDMFENITLYENKVADASYKKQPDGKYKVTFTVDAKKMYADSLGNESVAPLNDWIDVGVMARKKVEGKWQDKPLYLKKHKLKEGQNKFEFIVTEEPSKAGVDPYNILIDRNPTDNTKSMTASS
ncbi:ABC transporter permease/M1 family aminopeptidase [Pontibacter harenae]|uniref:ABC transporter permease/M1 family aminopeptidase n=1 Tax=Pontibacter harenae TaxID=2894083 RepID=UPI001E54BE74|nr:M1 family aminopeptidase [Pontibacter harenae]MCC9166714.1 ABC transporter permease subunit [Pontibacter harenae]